MTTQLFAKAGLSLERLRTFTEVVAAAGISHAAPGDSNRQSQFSRQLKELEEYFGTELLRRGHGRFELTTSGRELYQIVQSHFSALVDFADRCANQNVELNVGAGESLLNWLLLPRLAEFQALHPTVTLVFHNLRTEEITNRLSDGRIELGLVRHDAVRTPLKSARLGTIAYRLVIPRTSSKSPTGRTVWALLARHPVGVLAESEIAAAFEKEAEMKGIKLNVCFRASSYTQLNEAVRQIGCAAILPTFAALPLPPEWESFSISSFKGFERTIALGWNPRSRALRPTVDRAIESLTSILGVKRSSKITLRGG